MPAQPEYEEETKLKAIFSELKDGFRKLETLSSARQQSSVKDLVAKMQDAKTWDPYFRPLSPCALLIAQHIVLTVWILAGW